MPAGAFTNFLRRACVAIAIALTLATLSAAQTATTLHVFTGGTDGGNPYASLAVDKSGNLYGTTYDGGASGNGVIFEETAPATSSGTWTYSILYNFTGGNDGCCQLSTLAIDAFGRLYGATFSLKVGAAVFRLTPPAIQGDPWKFALLHRFNDPKAGGGTWTPLLIGKTGTLYAAYLGGGKTGCGDNGCGAVVEFVPPAKIGGAWTENTVYQFQGGADGGNPFTALVAGNNGVMYGATYVGGVVTSGCPLGCGVVYQLTPPSTSGGGWTESVIYTFPGQPDGAAPYSLTSDGSGALYGLASGQGKSNGGQLFQLIPPAKGQIAWTKTVIYNFSNEPYPPNNVVAGPNGVLYGTAFGDIDINLGYAYQLTPPATKGGTWIYASFTNLGPTQNPTGITPGPFGALYGLTEGGDNYGTVFELQP